MAVPASANRVRPYGLPAVLLAGLFAAGGCAGQPPPETVALDYARALYASDVAGTYRLLSAEDRRLKDERAFAQERDGPTGFALEVAQRLAALIEGNAAETAVRGERATVRLALRLPDANAPEIATLVHDWDEERLNALSATERRQVTARLADLRRAGRIPCSTWRRRSSWSGRIAAGAFFSTGPQGSGSASAPPPRGRRCLSE
jgi:hypothetical protein